eukprot:c40290_g1_i1.p1 GENE.c40290_g1_i1~~c40290_g1_i1.p1  ORF type:complete len:317 (-),score=84.56 c40290_g1_i1:52-960(-)
MTTRNLTSTFLSYRSTMRRRSHSLTDDTLRASKEGKNTLLGQTKEIEMSEVQYEMSPVWIETVDQIKEGLKKIKSRFDELQRAQSKHLLPGFDDVDDDPKQMVEVLTAEISRVFKLCESKIRILGKDVIAQDKNSTEAQILKNIRAKLAVELSDQYSAFRKSQKEYLSKVKGQEEIIQDYVPDSNDADTIVDTGFTSSQRQVVELNDELAREREAEIEKITESIEALAVLFKDLQTLVIDQGTILDRIDFNIEQAQVAVEQGVTQLEQAATTQKKSRLMLCIYILLVGCGALTLALILKNRK